MTFTHWNEKDCEDLFKAMDRWAGPMNKGIMCCCYINNEGLHEITYVNGNWLGPKYNKIEDCWLESAARNKWKILGFFDLKKEFGLKDVIDWFIACNKKEVELDIENKKEQIQKASEEYVLEMV